MKKTAGAGILANAGLMAGIAAPPAAARGASGGKDRPNVLWLTVEDMGPHLGCYGDDYATTPVLDALAKRSLLYENCWSTAPVCAPARTTLISGIYPPATGAEHMRSMTHLPKGFKMYPQYMREAGYYCTNNSKEDYNLQKPGEVWDVSGRNGHWKDRKPGQPFFAIFNHTGTHESKIRTRPHKAVLDPAKVRVPAYHPDTPEVRQDWAQYYDNITKMDGWVAEHLKALEDAGLAEDTIVFYYADHGSGQPRSKRWPYNSGLWVPLLVYVPPKFKHLAPKEYKTGGRSDRMVGFIDLAPTLLSAAGIKPPEEFQGHAFLGEYETPEQPYHYAFRGRMDERYDMVRSVRNKRYIYIKNYMPHKIYGQFIAYMFQTPTTRVWKELYDKGELNEVQSRFWETKPAEELYDLQKDPDEVNNLVKSSDHRKVLNELREAHREWVMRVRDVGFLPEQEIHDRSKDSSPYEVGHDDKKYPLERIFEMANAASSLRQKDAPKLLEGLKDPDSAVRYWAALGFLMRGKRGVAAGREALNKAIESDASTTVRVIAAEALGRYGNKKELASALDVLAAAADPEKNGYFDTLLALNAVDYLDDKAKPIIDKIVNLPTQGDFLPSRGKGYSSSLINKIKSDFGMETRRSRRR